MILSKMTEELDGCDVVVRTRKEGGLRVHRNVPYKFAIALPREDVINTCLPRPLKVSELPPLGVLKKVLIRARSWLLSKNSSSSSLSLRVSRP